MTNKEIAAQLNLLAKLMEVHGENSFKTKAYSSAAFRIDKLDYSLETAKSFNISGIGESISSKIKELVDTGELQLLKKYLEETPEGVLQMLKIKGVGPKKIGQLWRESGIVSLGELAYACTENRLAGLKGFGKKTQENVLKSIEFIQANDTFLLYADIHQIAEELKSKLKVAFPKNQFEITGEIRRQNIVTDKIEFITDASKKEIVTFFKGLDDMIISEQEQALISIESEKYPKIEIHFSISDQFLKDLFLTTNSSEFNASFQQQFILPETKVNDEASIFKLNQLIYIPPALRETAQQIAFYKSKDSEATIPLVELNDIKGVIHSHSTYSDGTNTLEEMAHGAIEKGFEYLVISDHSKSAAYANGLQPDRIVKQHIEIEALNKQLAPFKIFKSIESDILNDGSLDYENEILATFDLVIASVHSNLQMNEEKANERLLKAIENPFTRILGHPTGRLLLSRPGYPIDYRLIIDACAANDVVIEINAHPRRLDLDWSWIEYALEKGVLLSINPDAHSISGIDLVKYGVLASQKGGLSKDHNLSSFSLKEFESFLSRKK